MSHPPPSTHTTTNLLTTHRALLDTLTSFLTVCTHHILFLRSIYPPRSFLATRAYNYPVRQNRHPAVCTWINDAIASVRSQLAKSTVDKVALCIYECENNTTLERWTFDLHSLPTIPARDQDVPFELSSTNISSTSDNEANLPKPLNITALEATFRATLSRLTTASARLKPLPCTTETGPECSFTLTISLHPNADRPVGRIDKLERAWIVAEPEPFSQPEPSSSANVPLRPTGKAQDDGATTPIRRLEVGELRMELWVEESAAKFGYETPSHRTAAQRAKEMSYGAGTEKFEEVEGVRYDPERGYEDLEGTDVNRKPDGGRGGWPVG